MPVVYLTHTSIYKYHLTHACKYRNGMPHREYDNCDTYKMIIPKKYRNHHHINKEKIIGTVYYITIKWNSRKGVGA